MSTLRHGPSRATLALFTAGVVAAHLALLLIGPDALHVSLGAPIASVRTLQTRTLVPPHVRAAPSAKPPVQRAAPKVLAQETPEPTPASNTEKSEPAQAIANEAEPATTSAEAQSPTAVTPPVKEATSPSELSPPEPLGLAVGALPPSTLISYKLTGQERGLTYYANGELRWQHNPTNYEASLTIKAFLIGSRVFSSVGSVGPQGLMPLRHGDKWRGEKATHFDAPNHRILFSNNKPSADLQLGAQDQVSLYVQLAAAMAGEPERYKTGSSVSIQTATINDAVPWTLTLQSEEALQIDGKPVTTTKWVCLPRGKYDTQVELWLSRAHAWMPVRIRITQVSGSFIDMTMDGIQPLAPLASTPGAN